MARFSVAILIIFMLSADRVFAANSYVVAASSTMDINEHGICATVSNAGTKAIMVPTKIAPEWQSFRTHLPPLVTLSSCCPSGYVFVPGDSEQGTSNFCVMQYEAKKVNNLPTSQPDLPPWNYITHSEATKRCSDLGTGYSLISNAQWQTVIRNAENVGTNWSGGARGNGCFMMGNSSAAASKCHYDGGGLDHGTSRNNKARYVLSNGTVVWDFGGNVAEWVSGTFTRASEASLWNVGAPTFTAEERIKFGTRYVYTFGGCGANDDTAAQACGVRGFAYFNTSSSEIVRGGDYWDIHSDAFFTHWGVGGVSTHLEVGFRCAFDITQSQEDPCKATTAPSVGTACNGGSKYAGTYSGARYMVTSSGCNDNANPYCRGTNDTVRKTFDGGNPSSENIPGVADLATAADVDPNLGDHNTNAIADHSSVNPGSAAAWCRDLVYGGYDDWYLPNKEELRLLYTNKTAIGGFVSNVYMSSSENNSANVWLTNFSTGAETTGVKTTQRYIRCVRRF